LIEAHVLVGFFVALIDFLERLHAYTNYSFLCGVKLAENIWNVANFCLTDYLVNDEYIDFIPLNTIIRCKKRRSLGAVIFTHKTGRRCF